MHRLNFAATGAALIAAFAAAPAHASIFGTSQEDYLGVSGYFFMPDSAREASNGFGGAVHYGIGFSDRLWLEARGFGSMFDSDNPTLDQMGQIGAGLNLVFTPRGQQWFVTGGAGMSETGDDDRLSPTSYVDAGIGWRTLRQPSKPYRWRFEARGVDHVGHDSQVDIWLGAGIEFLLSSGPQAAAAAPLVAALADADEDGVEDSVDRCPASKRSARADANGCVWEEQIVTISDLFFPSKKSQPGPQTRAKLDKIVATYGEPPDTRIEIQGHADATATEAHNLKLSQERAEAVRRYLIEKGFAAEQLTVQAFGEMRPADSNETEAGKAANRRVELRVHTRQPG